MYGGIVVSAMPRSLLTQWKGGWVGPRTVLDTPWSREKYCGLARNHPWFLRYSVYSHNTVPNEVSWHAFANANILTKCNWVQELVILSIAFWKVMIFILLFNSEQSYIHSGTLHSINIHHTYLARETTFSRNEFVLWYLIMIRFNRVGWDISYIFSCIAMGYRIYCWQTVTLK
jgi:hypothetical protein